MPDSHLQCQNSIEEIRNHHESFPILLKNDFGYFTFWNKILILPAQTSSNKQSQTIFVPGIQYSESFKLVTKFPLVHIQQTQLLKNPIKATVYLLNLIVFFFFFFYLGFLSRTFTIHRPAGEEGGYLFSSLQPLPPTS